jgi:Family of unknown function (DUF5309)
MAVEANMIETYDNKVIREDLQEQYVMISPEELPFQAAIGTKTTDSTYFEWPVVDLAAPDINNRVPEGEQSPATDAGTLANRLGNYTQISDKKVVTSHTDEAVDSAAEDINRLAEQVALKMREMKRDVEMMLLQNIAAVPGAGQAATTRVSAGFPAFLKTNVVRAAGGANPTLSGGASGYPNAAATPGTTPAALTEDQFNEVIGKCWTAGAQPTMALVEALNKRVISKTFTGSATRYKDAVDKTLSAAIDVYVSDFGELDIVPTRFLPNTDFVAPSTLGNNIPVYVIDPDYARMVWLDEVKQKPLAETGHARSRLIWGEYGLQVDNEAAHGVIADTSGAAT